MRCRRCGHENAESARFCSSCGSALGDDEQTVSLEVAEERHALDEELGGALERLEGGLGMLVVRRGPNAGSTFVLDQDSTSLGRASDATIFLDDVTVSRRHAVVRRRDDDGYEIADVGSLNGTYLDHERIETAPLQDMSEIQVGRFVLTFVVGDRG